MLVECGYVRAETADGEEFTFLPSLARIAALGSPQEIVSLYADLFGPQAQQIAGYVLAVLCEQADPLPLIGWAEPDPEVDGKLIHHPGSMPEAEQVLIARHLMQHGICGKARPGQGGGDYSDRFEAAQYVASARVHLGMSSADAEALSMTELQMLLETKYPEQKREVPDQDEYEATMALVREKAGG
ncbi:hypothetical protein GN316_06690 [Xylophilus sp. Kf1]|nr:hypothetical protein [Xylophilus sp. Kf1]